MTKLSRRQFAGGVLAGTTALAMPSLAFGAAPKLICKKFSATYVWLSYGVGLPRAIENRVKLPTFIS